MYHWFETYILDVSFPFLTGKMKTLKGFSRFALELIDYGIETMNESSSLSA